MAEEIIFPQFISQVTITLGILSVCCRQFSTAITTMYAWPWETVTNLLLMGTTQRLYLSNTKTFIKKVKIPSLTNVAHVKSNASYLQTAELLVKIACNVCEADRIQARSLILLLFYSQWSIKSKKYVYFF